MRGLLYLLACLIAVGCAAVTAKYDFVTALNTDAIRASLLGKLGEQVLLMSTPLDNEQPRSL